MMINEYFVISLDYWDSERHTQVRFHPRANAALSQYCELGNSCMSEDGRGHTYIVYVTQFMTV